MSGDPRMAEHAFDETSARSLQQSVSDMLRDLHEPTSATVRVYGHPATFTLTGGTVAFDDATAGRVVFGALNLPAKVHTQPYSKNFKWIQAEGEAEQWILATLQTGVDCGFVDQTTWERDVGRVAKAWRSTSGELASTRLEGFPDTVLARLPDRRVRSWLTRQVDLSDDAIRILIGDPASEVVVWGLAKRQPAVPENLIEEILVDPSQAGSWGHQLIRGRRLDRRMVDLLFSSPWALMLINEVESDQEDLAGLVAGLPATARREWARHLWGASVQLIELLARDPDAEVRCSVCCRISSPYGRPRSEGQESRRELVEYEATRRFVNDPAPEVRAAAALLRINVDEIERLASDPDPEVRCEVVRRGDLPVDVVLQLAADPDPGVRHLVAQRRDLPNDVAIRLAGDADPAVRLATARSTDDEQVFAVLVDDPDETVRRIAVHRMSPNEELARSLMENDPSIEVRDAARDVLIRLGFRPRRLR